MNKDELITELEHSRIANQNKADMISISAHELKTALAAVKWSLNVLIDGDFGALTKEQKTLLSRVAHSNDRMLSVINDMLRISHTDGSIMTYTFESIDTVALTEEVIFDFISEASVRGVEVIFVKPDTPVIVQADKLKLRGVIQNLIENAIKYSERGGQVTVLLSAKDENMHLSVKDIGIGIPARDNDKVFDKFFRAENAMKKEPAGYGIGLYSVKRIVDKHEGNISFTSEEGTGTEFVVSIPLKKS